MSKHTKGDGIVDTSSVFAVTPDNLGKGIKWNPVTRKYEVSIASDAGNLLQVRDSGLYYGFEAKRELHNLYVSNNGNDANDGTRERPIRTLQRLAEILVDAPVTYHVHLHEGHIFDAPSYMRLPHSNVQFSVWGPTADTTYPFGTPCNLYYRGYMARNYPRPTIKFVTRTKDNAYVRDAMYFNKVEFYGIKLYAVTKVAGDDGTRSGVFPGIVNVAEQAEFYGCEVFKADKGEPVSGGNTYRDDVLIRGDVVWVTSKMTGVLQYLATYLFTSTFRVVGWNTGHVQGGCGFADYDSLVANHAEMVTNLQTAIIKFPANSNLMV